ncbi:MAG TPA: YfbM family protein [Allosphingosinicella sp.]
MGMVLYLRRVDGPIPGDPDEFYDEFMFSEDADANGDLVDFDKAWHAVHFLLTGSADESDGPLSLLGGKGEPIGEDNGYGPPLLVSAADMSAFNDALAAISDDELARRYDADAMLAADIYLADALARDGEAGREYVFQGIPALRRFAEKCARQGSDAIVLVS